MTLHQSAPEAVVSQQQQLCMFTVTAHAAAAGCTHRALSAIANGMLQKYSNNSSSNPLQFTQGPPVVL